MVNITFHGKLKERVKVNCQIRDESISVALSGLVRQLPVLQKARSEWPFYRNVCNGAEN